MQLARKDFESDWWVFVLPPSTTQTPTICVQKQAPISTCFSNVGNEEPPPSQLAWGFVRACAKFTFASTPLILFTYCIFIKASVQNGQPVLLCWFFTDTILSAARLVDQLPPVRASYQVCKPLVTWAPTVESDFTSPLCVDLLTLV